MMAYNMNILWNYFCEIINYGKSKYKTGAYGEVDKDGYILGDCVCAIKGAFWKDMQIFGTPVYEKNGVKDDWIGAIYEKATKKGTMDTLPNDNGIYCVYLNNEHIALYNSKTKTTIEYCGGNTQKCVERPLAFYDGTPYKWNKWSDLYYCPNEITEDYSKSTIPERFKVIKDGKQVNSYTKYNYAVNYCNKVNGIIIDSTTGLQIYPTVSTISNTVTVDKSNDYPTYTVKPHDTLWAIAVRKLGRGTRYTEIMRLNNLVDTIIYVGQNLKLPKE